MLCTHHFPIIVIVIYFVLTYEQYLILMKCYTGEPEGYQKVTIFEL